MANYRKYRKNLTIKRIPRVRRNWSGLQKAIFEEVANGLGNLHVDALAGTGKTTTAVEATYHIPPGKSVLMVAFNKDIAVELKSRVAENIKTSTLHSLGLKTVIKAFGKINIETDKLRGYIKAELGDESETLELRKNIEKAVSLSKGYLVEDSNELIEVINRHNVDLCDEPEEKFCSLVLHFMEVTKKDTKRIDFDDMIWFPYVYNLHPDKYDYVFVDEVQDLNLAQIDLTIRVTKQNGRIITFGDEKQAIYLFRSAALDAIDQIVDRMHSKRLPLSVTYRCGKAIVREAQALVENYEAAPSNPEGFVDTVTESYMKTNVEAGDFIISRTNAPLISLCLGFLKEGKRANIQGKDLGDSLLYMIKRSKTKEIIDLLEWVQDWKEKETQKYLKLNREKTAEIIGDKAECLIALCDGAVDLSEVRKRIEVLFHKGDDKTRIMLGTTHKMKGLERDRVWLIRSTYRPQQGGEEANLFYVAQTRAISELYYVK